MSSRSRYPVIYAALVHVLTASGAVLALLSLLAASAGRYEECFAFLGAALVVDGIDGPLARRFDVKRLLPRFSGEDLDKIIDYLTYVTIPAFLLATGGFMPDGFAYVAGSVVMLSSLYHFSDQQSKTPDGYFVGFPAIWNLVVFYLLVVPVPSSLGFAIIMILAALTFVPLKWIHPVRVRRLRPVTFALMGLWGVAAILALVQGLPGSPAVQAILVIVLIYGLALGLSAGWARPARQPAE